MSRRIKSIEYIYTPTDEESILTSHWFTQGVSHIMIWGSEMNISYEGWKAGLTPERKAKMLAEGYCTKGLTFSQTGNLSDLIGIKKEEKDGEQDTTTETGEPSQ